MSNRAFKYRIYPNQEQEELFMKTFGCCRKVWNLMLADKIARYQSDGSMLYNTPAMYKNDYPYLREVDSLALANVQLHLQSAYKAFFERPNIGFPKFKSRKNSRFSYTTNNQNGTVKVDCAARKIRLPKAGLVKAVIHREIPDGMRIKSATVSMERDGTFYCSVLCEYEEMVSPVQTPEQNAVGLDYRSDGLYVSSDGDVCGSPKYYRRSGKRLAKLQRELSRKVGSRKGEKESANHRKQRRKVAKLLRHVANQRRDYIHKRSTEIANRYDLVAVEDLNMQTLSNKGFGNGKATLDNGYGMFLDLLEYKLRDRGKTLIRVDKWFPSSQLCSCCGHQNPSVKSLSVRKWTCPVCGTPHDRDINAAVNIRNEGIRQYLAG